MEIATHTIQSVKEFPTLMDTDRVAKLKLAQQMAANKIRTMGYELKDDVVEKTSKFVAQLFVLHAAGDEKLTDEMKTTIIEMKDMYDTTVDLESQEFDFPPADNNVTIKFDQHVKPIVIP